MIDFLDYIYIGLYVLVILVLKEIIEYVFITRRGGNVITIETNATKSSTKTNEIGTNTSFKKKKGGKDNTIVEGFLDCPASDPISNSPTCDRATWLFCDTNFDKLIAILNAFTKSSSRGGRFDNNIAFDGDFGPVIKGKLENLASCMDIDFVSTGNYNNKIKLDAHLELVTNTTLFSDQYLTTGTNTIYDRPWELQRKFKVYTICTRDMIGLRKEYDQPNDDGGHFTGSIYMLVKNEFLC